MRAREIRSTTLNYFKSVRVFAYSTESASNFLTGIFLFIALYGKRLKVFYLVFYLFLSLPLRYSIWVVCAFCGRYLVNQKLQPHIFLALCMSIVVGGDCWKLSYEIVHIIVQMYRAQSLCYALEVKPFISVGFGSRAIQPSWKKNLRKIGRHFTAIPYTNTWIRLCGVTLPYRTNQFQYVQRQPPWLWRQTKWDVKNKHVPYIPNGKHEGGKA